jgi:hypothetical protein
MAWSLLPLVSYDLSRSIPMQQCVRERTCESRLSTTVGQEPDAG